MLTPSQAAFLLLFCALPLSAAEPHPVDAPAFLSPSDSVRTVENETAIGLSNSQTALLIRKRDGALLGIWRYGEPNLVASGPPTPLWVLEQSATAGEKPTRLQPSASEITFSSQGNDQERTLTLTYPINGGQVTVRAALSSTSPLVRWRAEVALPDSQAPLWSLYFPQIAVAGIDAEPQGNQLLVPYRRGQLRTFGKGGPRADIELPYPGPSAKFQFLAAYGNAARRGFYLAAEDGNGFSKSFVTRNLPASNSVVLAVQHQPADRGKGIRKYSTSYDVVTGPFAGDWHDAARVYREWWTKQEWASRGLLVNQRDLPQWLLHSAIAVRPSTTTTGRIVSNNLLTLKALSETFAPLPFMGIWYGATQHPEGNRPLDEGGHGHLLPPKEGLIDAVREVRARGVHLQAYIQSIIYDATLAKSEVAAAERAVTRDAKGQIVSYGTGDRAHLYSMCRATSFWNGRMVELSRRAVADWGFDGVYLDSFGKGATECFAPDHGHPIGGGNTVIQGQREMARKIRSVIRKANPEAIMSGEDPVEAFRDLLDVHLYAVNVTPNYVPIYRVVWGDYSLSHGRVLGPGPAFIPETAVMFLEGTLPGRIYTESPKLYLLRPEHATELAFLKSAVAYTEHALAHLRAGEYLHPLTLAPTLPLVEVTESVEKQLVKLPAVMNSVTRSHTDGSVAIALVNISDQERTVQIPIEPNLRGESLRSKPASLHRLRETGETTSLSTGDKTWQQSLTLKPAEIAVLLLL